ncbi:hypothetical protein CFC21_033918 [Triticum aestivum]|uniref:PGG domain-containing protein n=2 Tax=Triticum aestivum TaxID=4565 RepID=A0A9R1F2L6_WHEAT|nr:uncharacterized protein LOC119271139 [Triticum dicoccoides]XP_044336625.1 uncharacterized protein LOC123057804 [Triticum aestivum]KAF7020869.1 hypothetical protein CFC21_033918 [Triticum aestivum]
MDLIPMAESFPARMCEIEEEAECFRKNLRTRTSNSKQQALKPMPQPSKDHISVLLSTTDVYEAVEHVATKMASGLVVSDNGGGGGGDSSGSDNFGSQLDYTFIMSQHIKDMVNGGGDICELAAQVAIQVTNGLQIVPVTSPAAQVGANNNAHDDFSINIDQFNEEPPTTVLSSAQLSQALMTVALLTMAIDVGTVLYKPVRGVVFGHNKLAYYLTLAGIFIAGVAEALISSWLSRSHEVDKRCFSFGRAVLCASLVPFVAIIGIGGFAFVEG